MIAVHSALLADLAGAYRVCLGTADSGADASGIYSDPDLVGHVYVGPYLAAEASIASVVADETGVAGYMLGALDTRAFAAWCEENWWPGLRKRYPLGSASGADAQLVALIHSPDTLPNAIVDEYPSHLHIDLLPRAQGIGLGRTLIDGFRNQLVDRGSRGVHLVVGADNASAIAFYTHLGFEELEVFPGAIAMGMRLRA
jgi:ribosomal protein S18 acetylase RimI-like enzyme